MDNYRDNYMDNYRDNYMDNYMDKNGRIMGSEAFEMIKDV